MTAPPSFAEPYAPQLRTGLVLTGTGTAGAYHAGVLRALHEAGVKIDVVGGHGIGVIGAMFAASDGAERLWDEKGFWRAAAVRRLYPWRSMLRVAAGALALSVALVAIPIGAVALGLIVYPIDFVEKMLGVGRESDMLGAYLRFVQAAFAPEALPTWLPRLVVLLLGLVGVAALIVGWASGGTRRQRGPFWWRVLRPPLSSVQAVEQCWRTLWDLLRGAAHLKEPTPLELSRRFTELVAENIGQPGFREMVLAVHDLDAHQDLVFTLVAESRRRDLLRRATIEETEERRAGVLDLSGVAREYLPDVVAGALAVPVASEPSTLRFAPEAFWRGETHRLCDRPASVARVLEEMMDLDVEQILVVSAAPDARGPHALSPPRLDGRGRLGEYLQSAEAAAVRDLARLASSRPSVRIFPIRPAHNPVGPFDFHGGFDDRSDRRQPLDELIARGYEDAYHQFIEPVVGASGDHVGQGVPRNT
jgi:hypothetical protein